KDQIISWMKQVKGKGTQPGKKKESVKQGEDLSKLKSRLQTLVESGKLTQEDADKLLATMKGNGSKTQKSTAKVGEDWDAAYEKLLKDNPVIREKVESGDATKAQVIEFLKGKMGSADSKGAKPGAKGTKTEGRKRGNNFYALVIGKLKSKDIEIGELEIEVDYVISGRSQLNQDLVGQRLKLVGVSGNFLDDLLPIKRGETIKVRTGSYDAAKNQLGFGYKFQVLERTDPFEPSAFGVPPEQFRGFNGTLTGKILESAGYEVLLEVAKAEPSASSDAEDEESIVGSRLRIAGFLDQHKAAYDELKQGDKIQVSVSHPNIKSDAMTVTGLLEKIDE
ncbi:MAG: hypothetical protein VXX55_01005, partial [Planctomycetota bacterium]|nr:hypothetical protein [Planctomycetota bacterium]